MAGKSASKRPRKKPRRKAAPGSRGLAAADMIAADAPPEVEGLEKHMDGGGAWARTRDGGTVRPLRYARPDS